MKMTLNSNLKFQTQAAQATAEQQMAENMAQGFMGAPGGQFPYTLLGLQSIPPEQMHAFQQALASGSVAPEMAQHLLQHSANQVCSHSPNISQPPWHQLDQGSLKCDFSLHLHKGRATFQ